MVNFGYPYNDLVICKDSTDYLVLRCDDHTGIFTCDGCARTCTFMCPPRHRAMWLNFLAQGKSLPPVGIELGTFGLQRSRVSHVIHCASKAHNRLQNFSISLFLARILLDVPIWSTSLSSNLITIIVAERWFL